MPPDLRNPIVNLLQSSKRPVLMLFARHWARIAVTLIPLAFALLHASGAWRLDVLQRLDDIIYDARLRATMPETLDERIVIVDIDEKSLAEVGRWPWGRHRLAALMDELLVRQQVAVVGFDVVFGEADESSGLKQLRQLATGGLKNQAGFINQLAQLELRLDYDAAFARSIENRPVVLGYYFTSDRDGRVNGMLPAPVMEPGSLQGRSIQFLSWNGYGANLELLAKAAPRAGFFNSITDPDGVVRSIPLMAESGGQYYESLALAMLRMRLGSPTVAPGFAPSDVLGSGESKASSYQRLESILLTSGNTKLAIPVDERVATLVPYRGKGGPHGGSFQYIPAADLLAGRLGPGALKGKIVLVGTTAPGLLDLRVTPVGETYAGVETQANVLSGLLDGRVMVKPDYARGFDIVVLMGAGLLLAFTLPLLSASRAVAASMTVLAMLVGINLWLYLGYGLVLPLATALFMVLAASALNMSYGYFVESRSRRELANLFKTYVPPELVREMYRDPKRYTMQATSKELTVMFCDIRGFTGLSESMEPQQLQRLLNSVFTQLTEVIRANRGTVDKYMGDCVMAFWGAPVDEPTHAALAVKAAIEISQAIEKMNTGHQARGLQEIGIGIGINTGQMCVGDMGSDVRRSYTVIGDAVNLASRIEGLCKTYDVNIVVSEVTRAQAAAWQWQELDRVCVKGRKQAIAIFSPLPAIDKMTPCMEEQEKWKLALTTYRAQDWERCQALLLDLLRKSGEKYLYSLYAERVASRQRLPFDPQWDGTTSFDSK
jgi:adenylate cyclase